MTLRKNLQRNYRQAKSSLRSKSAKAEKTFGSVSSKEIAVAVKDPMQLDIDKKKIQLKESIKSLGTHIVTVKLHPEVSAELKVVVKEEDVRSSHGKYRSCHEANTPHSTEAEQAVLGAMLMNKDAITVTSEILAGQDFYQTAYGSYSTL